MLSWSLLTLRLVATTWLLFLSAVSALPKASPRNDGTGFTVGAAKLDITPAKNASWPALGEFDLEQLYIRAIVFDSDGEKGALLTVDIVSQSEDVYHDLAQKVAQELGTDVSRIMVSVTHAHGAQPDGDPLPAVMYGTGAINGYANLGDAAVVVVQQAAAKLAPGKVGFGRGSATLNANRDAISPITGLWTQDVNTSAPVDRELTVVGFSDPEGLPIAFYSSYAMHATNSYLCTFANADWTGAMSRWVEKSFNDSVVSLVAQQASGDVNPLHRRTGTDSLLALSGKPVTGLTIPQESVEEPLRDKKIPFQYPADLKHTRELFAELTATGTMIGEEAIRVYSNIRTWNSNPTVWSKQQNATCPGRTRLDNAREGVPGVYEPGPDVSIRISVMGLGDIAIAGVAAEIYTRIGWRIKDETPLNNTILVTLTNGKANSGYIPDSKSWDHLTFQVLGSKLQPGNCADVNISSTVESLVWDYKRSLGQYPSLNGTAS